MRQGRPSQEMATPGSMATGDNAADDMSGSPASGNDRLTREPTGVIRTTTIMSVAGRCMKVIGIAKTMAITTKTMVITTTTMAIATILTRPGSLLHKRWTCNVEAVTKLFVLI